MTDAPVVLPLTADELPDISDALIVTTVHMRAVLDWQRDARAAASAVADAADNHDLAALSRACRAFAAVPTSVERMPSMARMAAERFGRPGAVPALPDPAMDARVRRSLRKIGPWMEKRWNPAFGADDAPIPADLRAARPAMTPPAGPPAAKVKPCRKQMKGRLQLLDSELARLSADRRPVADTARLIMLADRNSHAGRCRVCAACHLADDPITRDIPMR